MKKPEKKKRIIFLVQLFVCGLILFNFITPEANALKIEYGYRGEFGVYGIADTAKAYSGNNLIAKARAIKIIDKNPGPNAIKIKETHYSRNGSVIYTGYLYIRFGFGGGHVIGEETISGRKQFNVFGSWPAGH